MKLLQVVYLLLLMIVVISCNTSQKLVGLWQIEKVKVGTQEMTPIARWTRLNADSTQESGNGWFQHSMGNWQYVSKDEKIRLVNSNGLKDEFDAFKVVKATEEAMVWLREEEGASVEVNLKKIEKIPQAPSNKILGAWRLKVGKKETAVSYLFFRWDQVLVSRQRGNQKKYGIYKTHGHKQEVQFVYYEDPLRQEDWTYRFNDNNNMVLESINKETETVLAYERIDYIPN